MNKSKQFKLILAVLTCLVVVAAGCSKNSSLTSPIINGSQVTFSISQQAGNQGGTQFLFKPSADIKISRIVSSLAAQNFADTITYANTNYVYSKDTTYVINEFTGIQAGQQWAFSFTGNGQNNTPYSVSVNYTAQ